MFPILLAAALATGAQAPSVAGIWDLSWKSHKGDSKSGWLLLRQQGARLSAEIHAKSGGNASGRLEGDRFELHGSRFFVPYTIVGRVRGDRVEGAIRMLTAEWPFTASRRKRG
jgi:hypothetical protein